MEIAGQHDRGGADAATIREGVDFRQKLFLSDSELSGGIEMLLRRNLIQSGGGKYFISESIASNLPRTASGEVSLRSRAWNELKNKLFES
ncbi:MAG TPA: hypothetical protein DC047_09120 [Blastocatellia bacterium]|nr:hypothetical protein [Blastocatellia bacterium]